MVVTFGHGSIGYDNPGTINFKIVPKKPVRHFSESYPLHLSVGGLGAVGGGSAQAICDILE